MQHSDSWNILLSKFLEILSNSDGKIELTILSYLFNYPIIIFDNYNVVKYIFEKGEKQVPSNFNYNESKYSNSSKVIKIKFDLESFNTIPYQIYSIYSI
jgi:hypothetical protein